MPRIRTIKPEFPQSESMGRVSRDARLTFVLLWTLADDAGRLRGNSRMLASLLFPYDDDAKSRIDDWLLELEREHCVQRYTVDGDAYLQVTNWDQHQRIDRPTPSKIPKFDEHARALASPREDSALDLGRDQGRDQGREGKALLSGKPDDAAQSDAVHAGTKAQCVELLEYLNTRAGKRFRPVEANVRLLAARLKESTSDEIRAVIDAKAAEWGADAKMAKYLRPETLFNATKFAGYVGELGAAPARTNGSAWWARAGFPSEGEAVEAGCQSWCWRQFRDGQRIPEQAA